MLYEVVESARGRVWDGKAGDVRFMRTIFSKLRRKLGDGAGYPTYIFTETRVGYRMTAGKNREGPSTTP